MSRPQCCGRRRRSLCHGEFCKSGETRFSPIAGVGQRRPAEASGLCSITEPVADRSVAGIMDRAREPAIIMNTPHRQIAHQDNEKTDTLGRHI